MSLEMAFICLLCSRILPTSRREKTADSGTATSAMSAIVGSNHSMIASAPRNCTMPEISPGAKPVTPPATVLTSPLRRLRRSPGRNCSSGSHAVSSTLR